MLLRHNPQQTWADILTQVNDELAHTITDTNMLMNAGAMKQNTSTTGYRVVLEELKQWLSGRSAKLKCYEDQVKQYKQNRVLETNQERPLFYFSYCISCLTTLIHLQYSNNFKLL